MRRRLFTFASLLSLLLCAATVVLWVRSYREYADISGFGGFLVISKDGVLSVFRTIPEGVTQHDFYYWKWALMFMVTPALWLVVWTARRRLLRPGYCPICSYNLTGDTSGICPECGTACTTCEPSNVGVEK